MRNNRNNKYIKDIHFCWVVKKWSVQMRSPFFVLKNSIGAIGAHGENLSNPILFVILVSCIYLSGY